MGEHTHDVEPAEFRFVVGRANGPVARDFGYQCSAPDYLIILTRVIGEAHGNPWYYNVLDIDRETTLPMHLLVEEGKHAMATDKNADGYYTPGYDVTTRINDAWGVTRHGARRHAVHRQFRGLDGQSASASASGAAAVARRQPAARAGS